MIATGIAKQLKFTRYTTSFEQPESYGSGSLGCFAAATGLGLGIRAASFLYIVVTSGQVTCWGRSRILFQLWRQLAL